MTTAMRRDPLHTEDDATAAGGLARAVCRRFLPTGPVEIVPLVGAGFSGSRVYRVRVGSGDSPATFVCKAYADGVDDARVRWIHRLMTGLRRAGVTEVPAVASSAAGDTVVTDSWGIHWELVEFRAGAPTESPTVRQAEAAVETLARLHVAAPACVATAVSAGPPPAIRRRVQLADRMRARPWDALARGAAPRAVSQPGTVPTDVVRDRLTAAVTIFAGTGPGVLERIRRIDLPDVPLQPVLRDVWADHVLFSAGESVGGLIDYHAAALDTPATDLARLLGSWTPPSPARDYFSGWEPTLAAYERIRPLHATERRLVPLLAATGILFGLDNWFRWLVVEERQFFRPDVVLARIDRLLADLPAALEFLAPGTGRGGLTG